jgi:hypothetical protein
VVGDNGEMPDLEFRRDLFRGTTRYDERFRVPYPQSLIDDPAARCAPPPRVTSSPGVTRRREDAVGWVRIGARPRISSAARRRPVG